MAAMALRGARDSLATTAILKKNKRLMIQQRSGRSFITCAAENAESSLGIPITKTNL
jgi:hypothetical protein